jgi:LmbE family N-acetylglucosaminyl deacetylase
MLSVKWHGDRLIGYPAHEITTVLDVSAFVEQKRQGILCHATQVGDASRYATAPDEVVTDRWFRQETYRLDHSTVGWPEGIEQDLLARLR